MTDRDCLAMPFSRLLLLYEKIAFIETEEEIRALVTFHTGDAKARLIELQEHLQGTGDHIIQHDEPITSEAGFVADAVADDILAERARQQASAARLKAAWDAARDAKAASDLPGTV